MIDRATIDKLAMLSRIELSEEEKVKIAKDLESILGYVSELSSAPVQEFDTELGPHINIFREDDGIIEPGFYTDKILANAPRTENGYLVVKQIIGEKGERK